MGFSNSRNRNSASSSRGGRNSEPRSSKKGGGRGSSKYGNSRSKRDEEVNWIRLGSLTKPKSKSDDPNYNDFCEDLMDFKFGANLTIYLGKGVDELVLKKGDLLNVKFMHPRDDDPDFVVGFVSLMDK